MATINTTFPFQTEAAIASYDYTDIAEGTGMIDFYGMTATTGQTINYILSQEINRSFTNTTAGTAQQNGISIEKDFDLTAFNTPKILKGTSIIVIPYKSVVTGSGKTARVHMEAKIRKWDGSTETEIASTSYYRTQGAGTQYLIDVFKIDIPQTNFKVGDILRITLIGTGDAAGAGSTGVTTITLYHNPLDESDPNIDTTQFKASIPFKLDL